MAKAKKSMTKEVKHGASNSMKGVKAGTSISVNKHGFGGSAYTTSVSAPPVNPIDKASTVKSSNAINQHKKLAMTGHT